MLTRRSFFAGAAGMIAVTPIAGVANQGPEIHVMKDPNCGCCTAWMKVLAEDGFAVTSENGFGSLLVDYKLDNGIPQNMISCHTAKVDGYMIEGHVPPADIRRLLAERPQAVGLAVPDMPYGSPGMGPEDQREAYDVFLIRRDGSTEIFQNYKAA